MQKSEVVINTFVF